MPTIGDTSKPSGGWHSYTGDSQVQQEAELLTMPVHGRIERIGAWIGGWSGTCRVYLCVWDPYSLAILSSVGPFTVANRGVGGPAGGNVDLVEADIPPINMTAGQLFLVGFDRHGADGHQISVGGTGGTHYEGRHGGSGSAWPGLFAIASGGPAPVTRRSGAYVARYVPLPGAKAYRSGAFVDATIVQVLRSGVWTDATVQIYRSGVWTDAE